MEHEFNPDVMYQRVVSAGEDWADKKAAYEALDDSSKSILAKIKAYCHAPSNAKSEEIALASDEYREHLTVKDKARHEWLLAEVRYKALVALAEWRRSQEATRRAEARII